MRGEGNGPSANARSIVVVVQEVVLLQINQTSGTTRTIRTKSPKILISDLIVRQDFIKNREELH